MTLVVAAILVLAFALFLNAVLKPGGLIACVLSLYLLSFADIVLVTEVASLFTLLNNLWAVLSLHSGLALAAAMLWLRLGRPPLLAGFSEVRGWFRLRALLASLKQNPDLWVLGAFVGWVYGVGAYLNLISPPNNNDSMHTHMSRVGYWFQHGSFNPWPTPHLFQLIYPIGAQTQTYWTVLFRGTDQFVGFVQWFAALVVGAIVIGLARLLGANRRGALFAGLLLLTFPEVILQSTTTQNDLVVAALVGAMLYFFYLGLRQNRLAPYLLSALALGLAIGVKQIVLFVLPGLGLAILAFWLGKKVNMRTLLAWGGTALAATLLLGSYMYVENLTVYGHPLGPPDYVASTAGGLSTTSFSDYLLVNASRLLYQGADPTGLPWTLHEPFARLRAQAGRAYARVFGVSMDGDLYTAPGHTFTFDATPLIQEDTAWYGPLGFVLLFPASIYLLVSGLHKKDGYRLGMFAIALGYFLCTAAFRPGWDPFQGRYFLIAAIPVMPLVAFFDRRGWAGFAFRAAVIVVAILVARNTVIKNVAKPFNTQAHFLTADRTGKLTFQGGGMKDIVRFVSKNVPEDTVLGLYTPANSWDYPFFGEHFTRRLIPVYPLENVRDAAWLQARNIAYLLVDAGLDAPPPVPPALSLMYQYEGWYLYARTAP